MSPQHDAEMERTQQMLGQRYQLQRVIGRGGMSTVWLATDTGHSPARDVAVKVLRPEYTDNEEFRTRFRNEAEVATNLESPNVVATYDYGEQFMDTHGMVFCYIVMEYVKGESLADILNRQQSLPEALVADLLSQAANGLETIHRAGMVHRDIKPGNLLITADGVVKIADFGIAKAAAAVPLTRTGMVVGTAQYVSPEQAQGLAVTPASDVYSLGVVGYESLAGQRPFVGDSTVSVAIKHISEEPAPLPENISEHMRQFINICLRKDPATRYATGGAMAAAAAAVHAGQVPVDPAPGYVSGSDAAGAAVDYPATTVTRAVPRETSAAGAHAAGAHAAGSARPAGSPAHANAAHTNAAARTPQRVEPAAASNKNNGWLIFITVALAAFALFMAGLYFLTNRDAQNSEQTPPTATTLTVTSEATSETNEPPTARTQELRTSQSTTSDEPTTETTPAETTTVVETVVEPQPSAPAPEPEAPAPPTTQPVETIEPPATPDTDINADGNTGTTGGGTAGANTGTNPGGAGNTTNP